MYSLIHHQGRKHPEYVWSLVFAWYITREYFLPKGSWLVLTASPWFLSVWVQAVGRKAGSPQKHRWVQHCLELWLLQGWSLHSQSHQAAAVGLLILISVVLHAGLNCPWLYRIAFWPCSIFWYYKHNSQALCFSWLQQQLLLDMDLSKDLNIAPVGHLGSYLVKHMCKIQSRGRQEN